MECKEYFICADVEKQPIFRIFIFLSFFSYLVADTMEPNEKFHRKGRRKLGFGGLFYFKTNIIRQS